MKHFWGILHMTEQQSGLTRRPTPEILAPAGSFEALEAAVRSGADAVYVGGSMFSARAAAKNFDNDALQDAVRYCHARGVRLHLALNTLLLERELSDALALAEFACTLPVDAIIVQDVGLLHLLRKSAPELPLHASTQLSVHTPKGARLLAEQGIARIVLARELSIAEIRAISQELRSSGFGHVEIEHFVHGALCMSVSGQCYFSSLLGSRSGNRGQCAQTCRLPFAAQGGNGYDLSLKDLSMPKRIPELLEAGVTSFKIEGRMKRPEYVAAATTACRLALDRQAIPLELTQNLEAVFSRSGFTAGYADGKLGKEMFGVRTKANVTDATSAVFGQIHGYYKNERQTVAVTCRLVVANAKPVTLTVADTDGHSVTVTAEPPQEAVNRPLEETRCTEQLKKTGGTPFCMTNVECELEPGLTMPISVLNQLRRQALDLLLIQRERHSAITFVPADLPQETPPDKPEPLPLRAVFAAVQHADLIPDAARQCELLYLPVGTGMEVVQELLDRGLPLAVTLPRGMFGVEMQIAKKLEQFLALGVRDVWAGTVNGVGLAKSLGCTVHGGYALNITNSAALAWYEQLGLADTELSYELTFQQAAALRGRLRRGLLLYGRLPLMLCRNCPCKVSDHTCKTCGGTAWLTDRKGVKFPVQCDHGCSEVINSVPLETADRLHALAGVQFGVLRFTVENSVEIAETFLRFSAQKLPESAYTRGLYEKGIF